MPSLTANQQAFVHLMQESEAAEADGFSILAGRDDAPRFFDALLEAGFFVPTKNKGPVPAENPQYVSIPYWKGLDYLAAVATYAGQMADVQLGDKIASVVVSVTKAATPDSVARDNFHTWRKFAELTAAIPLESIPDELMGLVPVWLSSRFDSGTIGDALGRQLLPRLLAAEDARYHRFALELFGHVTQIRWVADRPSRPERLSPITALDPYWVQQIASSHFSALAACLPRETVELLTKRVRDVFGQDIHATASWLFRPAVEQHAQNRDFNKTER